MPPEHGVGGSNPSGRATLISAPHWVYATLSASLDAAFCGPSSPTKEKPSPARSQTFQYDKLNRMITSETTSTYSSSPGHCWGEAYVYDNVNGGGGAWGNLTNINVANSAYNGCAPESLSQSVTTNNQISGFCYDADGNGNRLNEYVFFDGQRISRIDPNGNVYYYYADQVGSTTVITDGSGNPCYQATFTPYGEEHATQTTCPQNYKFTGYERDPETGLDYAFARYYNPRLGRFMSADPQTWNRYAYVRNSPLTETDPTGLDPNICEEFGPPCYDAWDPGSSVFGQTGSPIAFTMEAFLSFGVGANVYPPSSGGGGIIFGNDEFDALQAAASVPPPEGVYQPYGVFSISATGWSWSPDSFTGFQYTDSMGVQAPVIFSSWGSYSTWLTNMAVYGDEWNAELNGGGVLPAPPPDSGASGGFNNGGSSLGFEYHPSLQLPFLSIWTSKRFQAAVRACVYEAEAGASSSVLLSCLSNSSFGF